MQSSQLRSADDIARRLLIVGSLIFRAHLENEHELEKRPAATLRQLQEKLDAWMKQAGLDAQWTRKERALLEPALGAWTDKDIAEITWRAEALGMLAWSLGRVDAVPPYDAPFDVDSIVPTLNILDNATSVTTAARLRETDEIERQRDIAEMWSWRASTDQLQRRSGLVPSPSAMQPAVEKAVRAGAFAAPLGDDFPAFGKPYREMSPAEATRCAAIAVERLNALNWISGRTSDHG